MVAAHHAKPWREVWKSNDAEFANHVGKGFQELRREHLQEANETTKSIDTSANTIRASLKCFPSGTAIGADGIRLRTVTELPDVALTQLGGLFKQAEATLSLPKQSLIHIGALLGKKLGGSRVIAIMCSFYRSLMKCMNPKIREWDLEEGHRYDSALAGSSSLRAAGIRTFKIENATALGMHVGHLLWDMEK